MRSKKYLSLFVLLIFVIAFSSGCFKKQEQEKTTTEPVDMIVDTGAGKNTGGLEASKEKTDKIEPDSSVNSSDKRVLLERLKLSADSEDDLDVDEDEISIIEEEIDSSDVSEEEDIIEDDSEIDNL